MPFRLVSDYQPSGDQPDAIRELIEGVRRGDPYQTLLGVTGSGKTFTISNVIAQIGKPALIMSHNKTLAAQLYGEFKQFFPHDRVEFFISYYDYYQPEAYIPRTDTYIEKDSSINEQIDRMRHAATRALLEVGLYLLDRLLHGRLGRDVVAVGVDDDVVQRHRLLAGQGVNGGKFFDLVAEELYTDTLFDLIGRNNIDTIAPDAECTAGEIKIVPEVVDIE